MEARDLKKPYVTPENLSLKTALWKKEITPHNVRRQLLDSGSSALLVVDMQNYFLDESCGAWMNAAPAILPNVCGLVDAFRNAGLPVFFTTHVHENLEIDGGMMAQWWHDLIMKGTADAEIYAALAPRADEKVIQKTRYSAFFGTELDASLRQLGVKDLVITGVMTNLCCESTARDAFMRDYRVFFVMDATAATSEDFHLSTLRNLAYGFAVIVEAREILGML
jgi:isochorismate hydrolase